MIKCEEVCLFEEAFKRNLNDVEKKRQYSGKTGN